MPDAFLQERYDRLWSSSVDRIRTGQTDIDPTLAARAVDLRRGMTLLFRPSPAVRETIISFIEELRALEPDQYYYHPAEFHLTFLSLFTATEQHKPFFSRAEEYQAAVVAGIRGLVPFSMTFVGVTASPAAIMLQGFTDATMLNAARDRLREELVSRGLSQSLDSRYRLETAHMSIARFRQPLRDGKKLAEFLEEKRSFCFGETVIGNLELVRNDWYQSRDCTECLQSYRINYSEKKTV